MKKLVIGIFIALSVIVVKADTPFTNGILTNPISNTILAQAPAVDADHFQARASFVICSNVPAIIFFEHMSSTNTVIWSQAYTVAANDCREPLPRLLTTPEGSFFRLRLFGAVVGSMQATIFVE